MAYKFQLGTAYLEGATTYEDALTAEGAVSGAAGSFDAIDGTSLALQSGGISAAGAIAGVTTLDASQLASLDGGIDVNGAYTVSTAGAVVANEFKTDGNEFVVNTAGLVTATGIANSSAGMTGVGSLAGVSTIVASSTISGSGAGSFGSLTLDGAANLQSGGITNAGAVSGVSLLDASGLASLDGGIDVNGNMTVSTAGAIAGATTISGSGALSGFSLDVENGADFNSGGLSNAGAVSGVTTLVASSTVSGAAGSFDAITGTSLDAQSGGISNAGAIAGATTIGSSGAATLDSGANGSSFGGALTIAGALGGATTVSGSSTLKGLDLLLAPGKNIGIVGDTNLLQLEDQELNINGKLVISSVSAKVVDPNGSIPFMVWNDTNNAMDYVSWATFVTGVVGTGLSAANGKINLSSVGSVSAIGDLSVDLSEGLNYASASLSAARVFTLPAASSLSDGDVVRVKMAGGVSTSNTATLTCSVGAADDIDGEVSIVLESPYAAVELYKVADNTFRIL